MTSRHLPKSERQRGTAAEPARRFAALSRWLHIYLSMVSFGLVFFFALTGLTLNHADWFVGDRETTTHTSGTLDAQWVRPGADTDVAKLEVVEYLRRTAHVKGTLGEFRVEPAECAVVFKGPGYSAEARIERATGRFELSETRLGLVAVVNDLHKARDTGSAWGFIVDLSALLMLAVAITGLTLIVFIKRRFVSGIVTSVVGVAVAVTAYVLLVP